MDDYRGVSVLSCFGPVAFGDQQRGLFADVDEAEAFAAVDALNRTLLLSGFAQALVMAALSTFVARRLVEPIVDLAEAVEEMGELIANFNTMVSSLREQREAIEFKNTENTKLLLNVLPQPIAERLKDGETQIADAFPSASVVFTDLVGFTNWSRGLPPMVVLTMLDDLFGSFDEVASELGVEKIKTIGDAYMAVCRLPVPNAKHAETMALLAGRILICLEEFNARNGTQLRMRVGLHCGPVVAGVIGTSKFIYDLWGETINMASRMESTGLPDEIQISEAFYEALDGSYEVTPRGESEVKGVGTVSTYLLGKRAVRSTVDE
jgi:class 3 adenylate cyclase